VEKDYILQKKTSSEEKWTYVLKQTRLLELKTSQECGYCDIYRKVIDNALNCGGCPLHPTFCSNHSEDHSLFAEIMELIRKLKDKTEILRNEITKDIFG